MASSCADWIRESHRLNQEDADCAGRGNMDQARCVGGCLLLHLTGNRVGVGGSHAQSLQRQSSTRPPPQSTEPDRNARPSATPGLSGKQKVPSQQSLTRHDDHDRLPQEKLKNGAAPRPISHAPTRARANNEQSQFWWSCLFCLMAPGWQARTCRYTGKLC